ncbi:MAG: tetratricopeptide repeat protein, partial [Nannocystaceae bacterium]
MEFLLGDSLDVWVAQPRGWREILDVFIQAGRGVVAAHRVGIVHRDFKPQNVLVSEENLVKVLDFGLARASGEEVHEGLFASTSDALNPGSSASTSELLRPLTLTGALVGTPAYMSPEQYRGELVTAASDQFSFCVALYEALYQVRPFPGKTQRKVAHAIIRGEIIAPPEDTNVPQWVRRILLRGLEADPDARWPSMAHLLTALGKNPHKRRWQWASAGLLLVVSTALAYTFASWQLAGPPVDLRCSGAQEKLAGFWDAPLQRELQTKFEVSELPYARDTWNRVQARLDSYTKEWAALHEEACRATTIRGEQSQTMLDLQMACLGHNLVELHSLTELLATADEPVIERAIRSAAALPSNTRCTDLARLQSQIQEPIAPTDFEAVQSIERQLAQAHVRHEAALYELARELTRSAEQDARKLGYNRLIAAATLAHGRALVELGIFTKAEANFIDAYWTAESAHDDERKVEAATELVNLVGVRLARHDGGKAWEQAAEAGLRRLGGTKRLRARFLDATGAMYQQAGERELALERHREAREILLAELPENDPELAWSMNNLGIVYQASGDLEMAIEHFEDAIEIFRDAVGDQHPDVGVPLNNLGHALINQGKTAEAQAVFERVYELRRKVYGSEHPKLAHSLNALGNLHQQQGDLSLALSKFKLADKIWVKALGTQHPNVGYSSINLASIYLEKGNDDKAHEAFERAHHIWKAAYGPKHVTLGYSLDGLGQLALKRKQIDDAIRYFEQAVAIRRTGKAPPDERASSAEGLGRALEAKGTDRARVVDLYRQALQDYTDAGDTFASERASLEKRLKVLVKTP